MLASSMATMTISLRTGRGVMSASPMRSRHGPNASTTSSSVATAAMPAATVPTRRREMRMPVMRKGLEHRQFAGSREHGSRVGGDGHRVIPGMRSQGHGHEHRLAVDEPERDLGRADVDLFHLLHVAAHDEMRAVDGEGAAGNDRGWDQRFQ